MKIQLFLSGGGTRGIVFNLGCLAGLASLGALEDIRRVRTVSSSALLISLIYKINDGKFPTSEEFRRKNISEKILAAMSEIHFENLAKISCARQILTFKNPSIHTAILEIIRRNFLVDSLAGPIEKKPAWEICVMDATLCSVLSIPAAKLFNQNRMSLLRLLCASVCLIPKVKPMQINKSLMPGKADTEYLLLADAGIIDFLGIGSLFSDEPGEAYDFDVADLFIVSDASLPLIDLMGSPRSSGFWRVYKDLVRLHAINQSYKEKLRAKVQGGAFVDVHLNNKTPAPGNSPGISESHPIGSFRSMPRTLSDRIFEQAKAGTISQLKKSHKWS